MKLKDTHQIVTAENIEAVRSGIICDAAHRKALKPGCETWCFTFDGDRRGQITTWPDSDRGAVYFEGPTLWGKWESGVLVLDMEGEEESRSVDENGVIVT